MFLPMTVKNLRRCVAMLGVTFGLVFAAPRTSLAQSTCTLTVASYATFTNCTGTLSNGDRFAIRVPAPWNQTLIVHSLGLAPPGSTGRPFLVAPNQETAQWLLANGYAIAGSFAGPGLVINETIRDQLETLDTFRSLFPPPSRTIAWGGSFGGAIS